MASKDWYLINYGFFVVNYEGCSLGEIIDLNGF